MSGEASKDIPREELWGGGRSPFSVTYGKMMMWFFLVSDALTFSGLLIAYSLSRHDAEEAWPIGEQVFEALPGLGSGYPLIYVALMTFILIISSVTMVLAVEAGHRNNRRGVLKWLGLTVIGGAFFVGSQGWEWSHFIHGSGGHFKVGDNMSLTVSADQIQGYDQDSTFTITPQTNIFWDEHFAHAVEHYNEHGLFDHEEHAAPRHAGMHGEDEHAEEEHAHHGPSEEELAAAQETLHHMGIDDAKIMSITGTSDVNAGLIALHEEQEHGHDVVSEHMMPHKLYLNKYVEFRTELNEEQSAELWNNMAPNSYQSGANLSDNEYGPQVYADLFFFITGFHGFHVFSGVLINLIVFIMVYKGVFEKRKHYETVEKIGLYWHFVDLVWVFVFTFFYLV